MYYSLEVTCTTL